MNNEELQFWQTRFSPSREHRYTLLRSTGLMAPKPSPIFWVMLNPSTADEETNDPTIRRVIDFSSTFGFSIAIVLNLFAFRATDPKTMKQADDPIGPENDFWLTTALEYCRKTNSPLVCAWGVHGAFRQRQWQVAVMAEKHQQSDPLSCLGRTADGSPRHPLYVKKTKQLETWVAPPMPEQRS